MENVALREEIATTKRVTTSSKEHRVKEIGPHSSSYTPRHATNWHVLQSGTLLRFTVNYVSLTTLKRSGIAVPTSTGLLPVKTWIDWPVWTFTNELYFWNFWTSQLWHWVTEQRWDRKSASLSIEPRQRSRRSSRLPRFEISWQDEELNTPNVLIWLLLLPGLSSSTLAEVSRP